MAKWQIGRHNPAARVNATALVIQLFLPCVKLNSRSMREKNMSNPPMSDAVRQNIAQQDNHPLKGFAVIYEQKVEWGDMDAFNHVNNVVYYNYAQRARIHYLEQVDMFNLQTHTVIASSSCQYLNSVTFPDVLWIGIRAKKIGNTSLTHDYVYFSTAQQKVVATASSVIVFFDQTGKNKQPISDGQRQQLADLESHTV